MIEDGISILDEIKKGRYEASVIATFNAYFPFYEDVLLPHLRNSGSRQNVVLMDARVCGGILSVESLRPRYAGREYSLLPIKAGGAFHPKIVLLVGKKRALLLCGSHNLTLAGYSHNRELSSRFELFDTEDLSAGHPFRTAWIFINAWAKQIAEPLQQILREIETIAPWLTREEVSDVQASLISVLPQGKPLWEQVRAHIPKTLKRITITGPFFDANLTFLKRLQREFPSTEVVVGIDPDTVVINEQASTIFPLARFVTTDCLREGKGYLHAKAILLEEEDGSEILLSGSANPSEPAWIASVEKGGNAEIVAIHKSSKKEAMGKRLGLKQLAKAPPVSKESWEQIATRKTTTQTSVASGHAPLVALVTDSGITIHISSLKEAISSQIKVLDSHDALLLSAAAASSSQDQLELEIPQRELRSRAALLELETIKGRGLLAIVHHPDELRELAQTDRQRAMKDAMNSLNTETPMIEELMRIVEKVIFDDDMLVSHSSSTNQRADGGESEEEEEKVQKKFSIPLKEVARRGQAARRMISSGDLSVLLDALIHQLGIGLNASVYSAPVLARSEEELIGSEDEQIPIEEINKPALVAKCQHKVKTILRRMVRQLENAIKSDSGSLKALVQTAGVLGLIHRLCQVTSDEAAWIPRGETLVPEDSRYDFFVEATRLLYSKNGVMSAAAKKPEVASSVEASMVRGLLVWLAWDRDFQVTNPVSFDDPEEVEANLYGLARLVAMVPDLVNDSEAFQKANQAIEGSLHEYDALDYDSSWLSDFGRWCSEIDRLANNPRGSSVVSREAEPGDIAYPTKSAARRLFVVVEATQGRVRLIDLDSEDELKTYGSSYVTVVKAATLLSADRDIRTLRGRDQSL